MSTITDAVTGPEPVADDLVGFLATETTSDLTVIPRRYRRGSELA
jgi:hypothetical protein